MQATITKKEEQALLKDILNQESNWRYQLSQLLQLHHSALFSRCYAYLRNREDAEDATQETQLRAYRAIRNFRQEAGFRTWLFAIGDRQCHDLTRKRARHILSDHLRSLIEIHEQHLVTTAAPEGSDEMVKKAMTGLPRQEREVLMLRFYLELSLHEISAYLDLGLSATKMRLYRALGHFEAVMKKQQYPGANALI